MKYLTLIIITIALVGCKTGETKSQNKKPDKMMIKELTALIQPSTILDLQKSNDKTGSQFSSHFGGIPYFEQGESWPVNKKSGKSLSFVFQIVNNGKINVPNEIGVLQFYYDWDEMPWDTEDNGWLVKVYPKLSKEKAIVVEPKPGTIQSFFCNIRFIDSKSLPDWEGINEVDSTIANLSAKANPDEPWEAFDSAVVQLTGEPKYYSFIGGYPKWVQGESTPSSQSTKYKLLCQIDSEEKAEIMWGDAGSIYLFYNPANPADIKFTLQCY